MEDWKRKLVDAARPYLDGGTPRSRARREQLREWLLGRELNKIIDIKSAQHVVELMELIDRWHDEDVANKPCAAPAPPTNPFIVERIEREIKVANFGNFTIIGFNHQFVNINVPKCTYRPDQLRDLAKQLTDLADAHESIYPPTENACAKAC